MEGRRSYLCASTPKHGGFSVGYGVEARNQRDRFGCTAPRQQRRNLTGRDI